MTRLPNLSSRECIAALEKAGFYVDRQRGSHFIMYRDEPAAKVVVPMRKTLAKGTLRAIIRDAGMTVAEFVALL